MDKIYVKYADELKNALLSDNINRILIYGDDGRKIEYTRISSIDLANLPSAKPEIIHCGDCKYKDDGIDEDGIPFLKCLSGRSYGGTRINDYCSWAERKTDE